MKILDIVKKLDFVGIKNLNNFDVDSLSCSTADKNPNGVFFCVVGSNFDGHKFHKEAVAMGAKCLVVERYIDYPIMQILVKNSRVAMSKFACVFYGLDNTQMKIIGVTGTNGKTTTTFLVKNYLASLNESVGLIGTEGIYFNNLLLPSNLTTPDPIMLFKILHEMELSGIKYVVMEVSAHALALNKLEGLKFEVVALTNITQDHLDFFKSMQNYSRAKAQLFAEKYANKAVINVDDDYSMDIFKKTIISKKSLSLYLDADITVSFCDFNEKNTTATLRYQNQNINIQTNLLGRYNLQNTMTAISILLELGYSLIDIEKVINASQIVIPGRFNLLDTPTDYTVVVDFAHTPDGLKKVLKTAQEFTKNRVICVFGCGGNRDTSKRRIMGQVAEKYADYTFVTSDNPRDENPLLIINDITEKMIKNFETEQDRATAISKALDMAKTGDTVLILGKGAENYMEIKKVKYPYSDYQVVDEYFKKKHIKIAQ